MVLSDDFYYQPIRLDTINTQIYTDLIAKEGDAGGRGLKVTITENGVTKNTTGITLNLKWEHTAVADLQGLEPFEAVDLTKGIYKLKYPTNMLHKGTVKALIQIIDNGGLAGSRNLKIKVDSTVGDDTAIESSNEFRALASALVEVNGWNDRIDAVEADFIQRANDMEAIYPQQLVSLTSQLADTETRIDGIVTSAGNYYLKCLQTDTGALLVVASGAIAGQINLASVSPKLDTFTPIAGDYVRLVSNGLTAELIDTHLGADGITYPTAGGAIRGQLAKLTDNADKYNGKYTRNKLDLNNLTSGILDYATGNITANATWHCTDFIPVKRYDRIYCAKTNGANLVAVCLYDSSQVFVKAIFGTVVGDPYDFYVDDDRVAFARYNVYPETSFPRANNFFKIETDSYMRDVIEKPIKYTTYNILTNGSGDYTSLDACLTALQTNLKNPPSYYNRYTIQLGAGVFDIAGIATLIESAAWHRYGLFLLPYVELKGKGKDTTTVKLEYTGTNDDVMSFCSVLNCPYEAKMSDLTVIAKNIRYTIHSDNALATEASDLTNAKLSNNTVMCENVKFIHNGFDVGKTPSYKAPSAWGGGTYNGNKRIFKNCDFISLQNPAFANHDRLGVTESSLFVFENCKHISYKYADSIDANYDYPTVLLNSWGSNVKMQVTFDNCFVNKYVALKATTAYNASAKIDYEVKSSNGMIVKCDPTNNADKVSNYITSDCEMGLVAVDLTIGVPTSATNTLSITTYNSARKMFGIMTHNALTGTMAVVQTKGKMPLNVLTSTVFARGTKLEYNGTAWVTATTNPLVEVVADGIVQIL